MVTDKNQLKQAQARSRSDLQAHWLQEANLPMIDKNSQDTVNRQINKGEYLYLEFCLVSYCS